MSSKLLKVTVVSIAGNKSAVGLHTFLKKHPIYEKYVRRKKKYIFHDENNVLKVGDVVFIKETRPISKRKSWVFVNKVDRL